MERICPICSKKITRKRGNLRRMESWRKVVDQALERHVKKEHATPSGPQAEEDEGAGGAR